MAAPKGNKYSEGGRGGGRKGYEFEKAQLKEMRAIITKSLKVVRRIQANKATIKEVANFQLSMKLVLKVMDKLHANKQHIDWPEDKKLPFNMIIQKFDGKTGTENS